MANTIAESELIINERGAIYHLNLRPDELAPTIITVGDPNRVPEVSKHFDSIELKTSHREFVTHTGWLGSKRISVVSTGIGPDNIDIVFNELDALVNIDFNTRTIKKDLSSLNIVRIGTCGALQSEFEVDSMIVSSHGVGIDNLLNYYQHDNSEQENELLQRFIQHTKIDEHFSRPYIHSAGNSLRMHFIDGFHHGMTVTCPGFYGPQGRVLRLGLHYPNFIDLLTSFSYGNHKIANFEMETSAIYGLGAALGHQCLSISAVVANRISQTFSSDGKKAVESTIQKVLNVLSGI